MTKTEERLAAETNGAITMARLEVRLGEIEKATDRLSAIRSKLYNQTRGVTAAFIGERIAIIDGFAFSNDLVLTKD